VKQPDRESHERGHRLGAGHRRHRLDPGEVALQVPGGDGVAQGREDHEQAAHEGLRPAAGVHTEQHPHAHDPDRHADEARRVRALLTGEREGQQEGEDRRARYEDPGERRRDPLLAERDQRKRDRDLDERQHHDWAEAAAKAAEHPELRRKRNEHERGERRSDGDDGPRRHAVLQRDLDEQVGRAPERAEQQQHGDGAA